MRLAENKFAVGTLDVAHFVGIPVNCRQTRSPTWEILWRRLVGTVWAKNLSMYEAKVQTIILRHVRGLEQRKTLIISLLPKGIDWKSHLRAAWRIKWEKGSGHSWHSIRNDWRTWMEELLNMFQSPSFLPEFTTIFHNLLWDYSREKETEFNTIATFL